MIKKFKEHIESNTYIEHCPLIYKGLCSVRESGLCILQTMCIYLTDYFPIEWHYYQLLLVPFSLNSSKY